MEKKFYLCTNCGWVMRDHNDDEYKCYDQGNNAILPGECEKSHLKEISEQAYNEMIENECSADACDNMGIF